MIMSAVWKYFNAEGGDSAAASSCEHHMTKFRKQVSPDWLLPEP